VSTLATIGIYPGSVSLDGDATPPAPIIPRDILTWDGGASPTRAVMNSVITFTGDFEIQADVVVPFFGSTGALQMIAGQALANDYFGLSNLNRVVLRVASTTIEIAPITVTPFDGRIHRWVLRRVGSTATLTIDGVAQLSINVGTGNSVWGEIGNASAGTLPMEGQILNIQFTDNSVGSALLQEYNIDSNSITTEFAVGKSGADPEFVTFSNVLVTDWMNYLFNVTDARWESPEQSINGTFNADTDWTKGIGWSIASNVANSDNSQTGNSTLDNDGTLSIRGARYLASYTIVNHVVGSMTMFIGNMPTVPQSASGIYTEIVTAQIANLNYRLRAPADYESDIDNVSVKIILEIAY